MKILNNKERLFHNEVYLPDKLSYSARKLLSTNMKFTNHAMDHIKSKDDKKHNYSEDIVLEALKKIRLDKSIKPFEVGTIDNAHASKAVYRVKIDDSNDISIVVRKNLVITAWTNQTSDKHTTLDKSKYISKTRFDMH